MSVQVPKGYKQTEVGVIPEDWEVKTIDSVATVTSGKRLPLGKTLSKYETPHPYIRVTDMRPGTVLMTDLRFVPIDVFPAIKRYRIYKQDIFISVAGTLGIVGKIPDELDGANLTENADRISDITCSQDYLLHVLMSPLIQKTIESLQTIGAQPKLALARIRKFAIPLPSTKAEQQAIAKALSDADALIESLEQLIAKKRHIKQGAMQELLTGQRRLPGFSGEWSKRCLGDLGVFLKGAGVKKDEALSGNLPCIRYGEIYTKHNDWIREFESWISQSIAATATKINYGDVLFAASGETKEEIGKSVAYVDQREAYAGGDIIILRTKSADPLFLGYYLNTELVRQQKSSRGQGDTVVHIGANALAAINVALPSMEEQKAIAIVLSDMDIELSALESRLDKARQIKQSMMQELLTGRIRLI